MIEVNLLPGGAKRTKKAGGGGGAPFGLKLKLPSFGGGGGAAMDKWVLGAAAVVVIALGAMGYMFNDVRKKAGDAKVALEAAQKDSARFSDLIARTQLLTARRDSIGVRVGIIQKIDQNRYVWAHIMDEVARALPDYTWITELQQVSNDPITIRLTGQAGNNFALTVFMEQLEASPFLQGVTLIQSAQEMAGAAGGGPQQVVQGFQLEVGYVQPPMEYLQTVPLFEGETSATQTEKPDTSKAPAAAPAGAKPAPAPAKPAGKED